jgi:hypothetical protein
MISGCTGKGAALHTVKRLAVVTPCLDLARKRKPTENWALPKTGFMGFLVFIQT